MGLPGLALHFRHGTHIFSTSRSDDLNFKTANRDWMTARI